MRSVVLFTAIFSVAFAQELLLEEIRVKAQREPFTDSLEIREVRESSAKDLGEALQKIPGLYFLRKGPIANEIVLRGFRRDNIRIDLDGVYIYGACPNRMDPPEAHVDFSEVQKVEVVKGPYDVRHAGAMAGTVVVELKRPKPGFHMNLNLSAGSFSFFNPSGSISYADDKFFGLAGFSYRYSKPYKDGDGKRITEYANYKADAINSTAFNIRTGWLRFGFSPIEGHQLEVSYTKQKMDHVLYPALMMDAVYDNANRFGLKYKVKDLLNLELYYSDVDHWMDSRYRISPYMATDAKTKAYGGRLEGNWKGLLMGFEAYYRNWDAINYMMNMSQNVIPDVDVKSFGVYGQYTKDVGQNLKLTAGLRLDTTKTEADSSKANTNLYFDYHGTRSTSKTDVYPSGNIQLTYKPAKDLEIFMGLGHAVRVPDPQERYFAFKRMSGWDWVGNPELKPSRNTQLDLGLRHSTPRNLFKANLYYSYVMDYITLYKQNKINNTSGSMNKQAMSYANVNARFFGFELEDRLSLTDTLFVLASAAYVDARKDTKPNKNIKDKDVAEIPPLNGRVALRYDTGLYFGELEMVAFATQYKVDSDVNEQRTSGYAVLNLKAGVNYKSLTVNAGVDNLLDKKYYSYLSYVRNPFSTGVKVPEPGRTFYLSASYSF